MYQQSTVVIIKKSKKLKAVFKATRNQSSELVSGLSQPHNPQTNQPNKRAAKKAEIEVKN